jgi:Bacterial regulatory helix-turn-helix protein, lysR family/Glutathione S-transferase, N-terminal domain
MDLKRLRTFVTVTESGTVSGAAETLRVTQPALSRQLQYLQAEFGLPLFDQVGRRLRLTTEGAELLKHSRALLGQVDADGARAFAVGRRQRRVSSRRGPPPSQLLNGRPTAARDRHVTCVFVGRSKKWANDVRLVSFCEMKEPAHRALHPFGQIPTYEEGDLTLFESGSIVFHIAERHGGLLPDDANALVNEVIEAFGQ